MRVSENPHTSGTRTQTVRFIFGETATLGKGKYENSPGVLLVPRLLGPWILVDHGS